MGWFLQLISNDGDTLMFTFQTKMIAIGVKMLEWLLSRRVTKDSGKEACEKCSQNEGILSVFWKF